MRTSIYGLGRFGCLVCLLLKNKNKNESIYPSYIRHGLNCVIIIACKWLRLRSAQSCPSGKHSNPLLVFGSVPQSSGNTLSFPVARGVLVPPMPPALLDGISLPVLELTAGPARLLILKDFPSCTFIPSCTIIKFTHFSLLDLLSSSKDFKFSRKASPMSYQYFNFLLIVDFWVKNSATICT